MGFVWIVCQGRVLVVSVRGAGLGVVGGLRPNVGAGGERAEGGGGSRTHTMVCMVIPSNIANAAAILLGTRQGTSCITEEHSTCGKWGRAPWVGARQLPEQSSAGWRGLGAFVPTSAGSGMVADQRQLTAGDGPTPPASGPQHQGFVMQACWLRGVAGRGAWTGGIRCECTGLPGVLCARHRAAGASALMCQPFCLLCPRARGGAPLYFRQGCPCRLCTP